jgi:hypothetical protein
MYCGLEGVKEGGWGRKKGNIEHTVVLNATLWNDGFQ